MNDDQDYGKKYLMIENRGLADVKLLTIVGLSGSRYNPDAIGQFGSGTKYSLAQLLRKNIDVKLFTGKQGYCFGFDRDTGREVTGRQVEIKEIYMQGFVGTSKAKQKLSLDASWGELEWEDAGMAVREFVSNAADASMSLNNNYSECCVRYVYEDDIKAREGYTRVFIACHPEIQKFADDINKHFMIFDKDYNPKIKIMPKRAGSKSGLRVYRKGVLVGDYPDERSLFDYNLPDITVTESRIITFDNARDLIAVALKNASQEILEDYFRAIESRKDVFEVMQVNSWSLTPSQYDDEYQAQLANWQGAFKSVFTDSAVICDNSFTEDASRRKGYNPVTVEPEMARALRAFQLPDSGAILDHFEAKGQMKVDLTTDQINKMQELWDLLVELGMTKNRKMPKLEGFSTLSEGGSVTKAYYDPSRDTVGMSTDILDDAGHYFYECALEEFGHRATKATDFTRDLQNFAFKVAGHLILRELQRRKK